MISKDLLQGLKVGQVVKWDNGNKFLIKTNNGIYWCTKAGEPVDKFIINDNFANLHWSIVK